MRLAWAALLALGLSACAATPATDQAVTSTPFDPATRCYERDFVVYFEEGETTINHAAREAMAAMVDAVRLCRIDGVRVVGLTDAEGNSEENLRVAYRRAEMIRDHLVRTARWPRDNFSLASGGESGATTSEGLNRPVRNQARISVQAVAP